MRYVLLLFSCLNLTTVCHSEETHLQPGGVNGSITPNDVQITVTLKTAGKELIGENIKGSVTLTNGGSFDFSDVPPGKYDLMFTLHEDSRYKYFVDNWSNIVVKPGQITSGVDYRLTSQDTNYLIDEIVVEFPNDIPKDKVISYIEQLNCHLTREPLDLLTTFYFLNIPDDKTVDELIEEFKKLPELQSVSRREVSPTHREPIEGNAKFALGEVFAEGSVYEGVLLNFNIFTEKIYPCSNYQIKSQIKKQGALISIVAAEVYRGDICLTSMGPARASESLFLPFGGYNIVFEYANTKERYSLYLTEPRITVKGLDPSAKSSESNLWRRPNQSFVYLCGTTIKTSWICEDFIRAVRSSVDLKEIHFPNSGKTLYPAQSGGHYYDMPARFFLYDNEEDYETVGKILERYNESTVSTKSGVSLHLINWQDKHYRSWMFKLKK